LGVSFNQWKPRLLLKQLFYHRRNPERVVRLAHEMPHQTFGVLSEEKGIWSVHLAVLARESPSAQYNDLRILAVYQVAGVARNMMSIIRFSHCKTLT